MSSTRNPTVLYGVQVLQTIVYYTYIRIVFNNFGTIAKAIISLYYEPGYANLIGRDAPKVWTQACMVTTTTATTTYSTTTSNTATTTTAMSSTRTQTVQVVQTTLY